MTDQGQSKLRRAVEYFGQREIDEPASSEDLRWLADAIAEEVERIDANDRDTNEALNDALARAARLAEIERRYPEPDDRTAAIEALMEAHSEWDKQTPGLREWSDFLAILEARGFGIVRLG